MTSENDDESPRLCLECQSKLLSESTLIEGIVLHNFTFYNSSLSLVCPSPALLYSLPISHSCNQIIHGAQDMQLSMLYTSDI